MAPIFIEAIIKAYEKTVQFGDNVVKSIDEEKFARAVNDIYGKEPTLDEWDAAVEIIKDDKTMDTEKKIALLKLVSDEKAKIRQQIADEKARIAENIDKHEKNRSQIAVDIVTGVLTGGLSHIPKVVEAVRENDTKKQLEGTDTIKVVNNVPEDELVIEVDE